MTRLIEKIVRAQHHTTLRQHRTKPSFSSIKLIWRNEIATAEDFQHEKEGASSAALFYHLF